MIVSEEKIRVRYDEVDKMGYLYHGNYARYFHVGRTELLRKLGISDKQLESLNLILPVVEMNTKYLKPIQYDEIITLKTYLNEIPKIRIKFYYEIFNENGDLVNEANSSLVFVDNYTRKPMRVPKSILNKIEPFFNS
ncbi:MAG: thioesterase [Bacteroidetes bacterium 4572_117]|nr:MAG: thioesterase [Bacteroidetes bacterium 4572_117]